MISLMMTLFKIETNRNKTFAKLTWPVMIQTVIVDLNTGKTKRVTLPAEGNILEEANDKESTKEIKIECW